MSEKAGSTVTETKKGGLPGWAIWAIVLLIVFLLGFVPMWLQYRSAVQTNEELQKQLRKSEVKNYLTTAIVEARSGEYETGRQNASEFFTNLDAEIKRADEGNLTAAERERLKPVLTNRDNIITMLAQRDPASAERLMDIYAIYKQAFGQMTTAQTPVPAP
jgi:hypothetical protein